ncbi:MAG TPA: hypothetical protein VFI23_01980 [Rhizomicrobium sp.]|nr:hypothetical protein [Rhizomicrobium sp.]
MRLMFALLCAFIAVPAVANTAGIPMLRGEIRPASAKSLKAIACRNIGRVVQLDILVKWPKDDLEREGKEYRRLIFSMEDPPNSVESTEYLFYPGTYRYLGNGYAVTGFFQPHWERHSGTTSLAFIPASKKVIASRPRRQPIPPYC